MLGGWMTSSSWARRIARVRLVIAAGLTLAASTAQADPPQRVRVATVAGLPVWKQQDPVAAVFFRAGMTIDCDGAPKAYHRDSSQALHDLANAGHPGNWWALVTKDGHPIVQTAEDPAPGYYVSMTSLQDRRYKASDPRHYVDASQIPYIALPKSVVAAGKVRLGDVAVVVNQANEKRVFAIVADVGPRDKLGEGSIYLANQLRDHPDLSPGAKGGSFPKQIVYVIFPGSGNGQPKSREAIASVGARLFEQWGGMAAVQAATFARVGP
jgi:hypothetical protein